ncbi:MAG: rhodanese-like domain-containing protein, partial [Planctomycetota bacterium]
MKQTGKTYGHRMRLVVLGIIVAGGLAPLILYWLLWGRIPSVTPIQAKELLRMTNSSAILVDVRSSDEFDSSHIDGAQNWPVTEILATHSKSEVPEQFRDKTLLLISNVGVAGRSATKH